MPRIKCVCVELLLDLYILLMYLYLYCFIFASHFIQDLDKMYCSFQPTFSLKCHTWVNFGSTICRYIHQAINPNDPPAVPQPKPTYPYKTVGCVFNHHNFYANCQVWRIVGINEHNYCPLFRYSSDMVTRREMQKGRWWWISRQEWKWLW